MKKFSKLFSAYFSSLFFPTIKTVFRYLFLSRVYYRSFAFRFFVFGKDYVETTANRSHEYLVVLGPPFYS